VQELELGLEVIGHAQPDFSDLRLIRDRHQLPYILEPTSITRALAITASPANDPKKPNQSRWSLKLPQRGLPVTRLVCNSDTPLFKRDMRLYEVLTDDRGNSYESDLAHTSWVQTPERKSNQFTIELIRPTSDTLYLETDNGDNPPIKLSKFQLYYPVTRVLFKSTAAPLYLYYGNREAGPPSYDLSLVASQILTADKTGPSTGLEEQLRKETWREANGGKGGYVFWGVLGVVVIGLFLVISQLLPKQISK
jgi:hypothetical protein